MKLATWGVLGVSLAACSGSGSGRASGPATIRIDTGQPPEILAFREDTSSTWTSLVAPGRASYEVVANGRYHVVVGCSQVEPLPIKYLVEFARTPEDDPEIAYPCPPMQPRRVTATIQRKGAAAIGVWSFPGFAPPWTFQAPSSDGVFDLVMWFDDDAGARRIAIRRDVSITGDTDLGVIDPAAEDHHAMVPVSFTASNLEPGDKPALSNALHAGNTVAHIDQVLPSNGWSTSLAPDAALRSSDRQTVTLYVTNDATGPSVTRGVSRRVHVGDPTRVVLPARLGPVAIQTSADETSAAWATLPDYDVLTLLRRGLTPDQVWLYQQTSTTRSFIEGIRGATSVTVSLSSVPGVTGPWRSAVFSSQESTFTVMRGTEDDYEFASVTD